MSPEEIARSIHDEEVNAMRERVEPIPSEAWCALCTLPAEVEDREPNGDAVSLCGVHRRLGPCDDCGRWVGHNDDVEH